MPSNRVAWHRAWPHGRFKFMCGPCKDIYTTAFAKPLKGIDRPEGVAPEDWRPSLMDHLRHAQIAMAFEERKRALLPAPSSAGFMDRYWRDYATRRGFTPAQYSQLQTLVALTRRYAQP